MKLPWQVNKTHTFVKCVEKEKISDSTVEAIETWIKTFTLVQTSSSKCVFISPTRIFQIWNVRIPDPDSKKGKSGGFRLICFFTSDEAYLDLIESRKGMGFKQEHPKDKQRYTNYINDLKKELLSTYENHN